MSNYTEMLAALEEKDRAPAQPEPQGTSYTEMLAELEARDQAAAQKKGQAEFDAREAEKGTVERRLGEVGRGLHRGAEATWVGAADVLGDALEGVGAPRFFPEKDTYEKANPYSSGSLLERGAEVVGEIGSIPGGGAGKTAARTVAKNIAPSAVYGAAHSEGEGAERVFDAAESGLIGGVAGLAGDKALDLVGKGIANVSPKARKLEQSIKAKLGDKALSGDLPLAQRVDDSTVMGKVLKNAVPRLNTGKRAARAKDRSQRVNDDVYRMQTQEAFSDVPEAAAAAERSYMLNRDPKKSFKEGMDEIKKGKGLSSEKQAEFQTLQKKWDDKLINNEKQFNDELLGLQRANIKEKEMLTNELNAGIDKARALNKARKKGEPRVNLKRSIAANTRKKQELALLHREAVKELKSTNKLYTKGVKEAANNELGNFMRTNMAMSAGNIAKRDQLKKNIGTGKGFGRYSHKSVRQGGDEATADLMSPLRIPQAMPDKTSITRKIGGGLAEVGSTATGMVGGAMVGGSSFGPVGAVTGALTGGTLGEVSAKAIKAGLRRLLKKEGKSDYMQKAKLKFVDEVSELKPLRDPKFQRALLGDTEVQKKMTAAINSGDLDAIKAAIAQVTGRSAAYVAEE